MEDIAKKLKSGNYHFYRYHTTLKKNSKMGFPTHLFSREISNTAPPGVFRALSGAVPLVLGGVESEPRALRCPFT